MIYDSQVTRVISCAVVFFFFKPLIASAAQGPAAVSTFHCIGLYWSPSDGAADNICRVRYRVAGSESWKEALPLWFDARPPGVFGRMFTDTKQQPKSVTWFSHQYRGSIVNLQPQTQYEIELFLEETNRRVQLTARTWSEDFPIGPKIVLPESSNKTLVIDQAGSVDGYILYTCGKNDDTAAIDVANQREHCVEIRASYIILRGLNLKGAQIHGIRVLDGSHDVVIEDCDISGWGRPCRVEGKKWARNFDSAVYAYEKNKQNPTIERIIVQRCRIHHPRYDTNSWQEYRKVIDPQKNQKRWHPRGPQAITFVNTAGNHVIRYNEVWSDAEHYYNDIFGGGSNFSAAGSPNRDSDIYCNRFQHCWDDGIEAEGANCNVRIWGNYISHTMVAVATASTHVGPLYIWRNVSAISQRGPQITSGGPFLKAGLNSGFGGGRTFVFHNTFLQPLPTRKIMHHRGVSVGLSSWGGGIINHVSRNNILHVAQPSGGSIQERSGVSRDNDYDYDLFNGQLEAVSQHEKHGVKSKPMYDPRNKPGQYFLAPDSPGYDAGTRIPNFNDGYSGRAPDVGAYEAGTEPLQFGVDAHRRH